MRIKTTEFCLLFKKRCHEAAKLMRNEGKTKKVYENTFSKSYMYYVIRVFLRRRNTYSFGLIIL